MSFKVMIRVALTASILLSGVIAKADFGFNDGRGGYGSNDYDRGSYGDYGRGGYDDRYDGRGYGDRDWDRGPGRDHGRGRVSGACLAAISNAETQLNLVYTAAGAVNKLRAECGGRPECQAKVNFATLIWMQQIERAKDAAKKRDRTCAESN